MRLGLVLAEVGRSANVQITDEELTRALIERARGFPGQEKEVWDYYRNNQNALAELRAPIYEEKAVDHILGLAKIEDRKVDARGAVEARGGRNRQAAAAPQLQPKPSKPPSRRTGSSRRPRLKVNARSAATPLFARDGAPMLRTALKRF